MHFLNKFFKIYIQKKMYYVQVKNNYSIGYTILIHGHMLYIINKKS